jgi:hypothetical protein
VPVQRVCGAAEEARDQDAEADAEGALHLLHLRRVCVSSAEDLRLVFAEGTDGVVGQSVRGQVWGVRGRGAAERGWGGAGVDCLTVDMLSPGPLAR